MGISVQASGIMVEKNKYYLVNLNADPSLNELLVYYLKVIAVFCVCRETKLNFSNQQEHTLVGRKEAPVEQDIQLSGLGIQPEHCVLKDRKSVV